MVCSVEAAALAPCPVAGTLLHSEMAFSCSRLGVLTSAPATMSANILPIVIVDVILMLSSGRMPEASSEWTARDERLGSGSNRYLEHTDHAAVDGVAHSGLTAQPTPGALGVGADAGAVIIQELEGR